MFRISNIPLSFEVLKVSYIKIKAMNKIIFFAMPWLFAAMGYKATAQVEQVEKVEVITKDDKRKDKQEIVISRKGEKDATVTIQFKDDKVLINGKPMIEFKDDAISINNRVYSFKQIEKDFEGYGRDMEGFARDMEGFGKEMELAFAGKMPPGGPFLGVVTEKVADGAKIEEIIKGSAAEKSDLKVGDVITKVNDQKVNGPGELAEILQSFEPKKEVKVYYKRDGKDKNTKVTLQERNVTTYAFNGPDGGSKSYSFPRPPRAPRAPRAPGAPGAPPLPPGMFEEIEIEHGDGNFFGRQPRLGLKIQDLEEGSGVKVLEVEEGSAASTAGLKKDDVITQIGTQKVANTDEAREQLMENGSKATYTIVAKRNNAEMKFEVKIPKKLKTANL